MNHIIPLSEQNLTNDFLFKYVMENPSLTLNDGTVKMIICTKGQGQISREFKDFLTYIENSTPEVAKGLHSPMIERLSERVETVKRDKVMGEMYMVYEDRIAEAKAEGIREGISQGIIEGRQKTLVDLYTEGLITAENAAEKLGITVDEFLKLSK